MQAMKAVAICKWAMNPQDERLDSEGNIKWHAKRPEAGDDDFAAVGVAEVCAGDQDVYGLTSASGDVAFAAARGAAETYTYDDIPVDAQPQEVAATLAAAVRALGDVDVVSIGDSEWNPAVPGLLAGMLGIPAILAVDSVQLDGDGLLVTRRFGPGTQDIHVGTPVLLGVAARREEESKPGMRTVLQARKKPVTKLEELAVTAPTAQQIDAHAPDSAPAKVFDGADPDAAVSQLIKALQTEGVL